ncbi:MAG: HAMP domain-containing sensor histidine kinase [Bacteroidales bacterium]|nr:HAMP domain-containing sensor histidine kinase [Bacteroidales bacterium]
MEHDIIEKSEKELAIAVENELFERFNNNPLKIYVHKGGKSTQSTIPTSKIVSNGVMNQSKDFNTSLQQTLVLMGAPCSLERIDTLFQENMFESIGFVPQYNIKFIDSKQKDSEKPSKFTIYAKVTNKQYVKVVLNSPLGSILRQAQLILVSSVLLVILIGIILVYQLKSMLRENHFVSFIKEYTHALTHELKTPISGIYMSASQLASGVFEEKPESRQRYYQMCKDQSQKLLTTVDRILLVAKAEHSQITPNKVETDIKPFVDKIVDNRRQNNFRMKDIELITEYQSEYLVASFDPFLMDNVLNNLIDNAVKYSDNSVKIVVSCAIIDKKLHIKVKDNGFGIPDKEQKHIFNSFERGDKVQGKGIDGFGIGLNYVNKVIKAHHGSISVKSKEGLGSEFLIEIPNK